MDGHHKILLVEDNEDTRQSLSLLLEAKGYEVDAAENGREALRMIRGKDRFCLVLLDLWMPVMDGWEFRRELLKDRQLASVPIVLLSAQRNLKQEAEALAAVDHLTKPIDVRSLYRVLEKYC